MHGPVSAMNGSTPVREYRILVEPTYLLCYSYSGCYNSFTFKIPFFNSESNNLFDLVITMIYFYKSYLHLQYIHIQGGSRENLKETENE